VIDRRSADDRFHTELSWLDSWHSFSFGDHYDPANTGHGLLLVSNDDVVGPATGFGPHPHRDMEIVTWVLSGSLEHRDSEGNVGLLEPGLAQRMSAGTGIRHSEMNPDPDVPVRLVQMWVRPDTVGVPPGYEQVDVTDRLAAGGLVAVASGDPEVDSAIRIRQREATMWVARLDDDEAVELPVAPHVHVFVATGAVQVDGVDGPVGRGDALRLTGEGSLVARATEAGTELIVWATA
jgi:redox-sensitive bicupin YhaK (pirin superfamily)